MWYENYLIKQACIKKEAILGRNPSSMAGAANQGSFWNAPFKRMGEGAYNALDWIGRQFGAGIKGGLPGTARQSVKATNPIRHLPYVGGAAGVAGVAARNLLKPRTVPNFGANLMQVPQYPINEAANMQQAATAQAGDRIWATVNRR